MKSLDRTVSICENCAKDTSTLAFIVSRLAAVDPLDDIEVRVRHKYHSAGESDIEKISGDRLKEYMLGKVTDVNVIASVKRARLGSLKEGASSTYIIGTRNYGDDLEGFMSALEGEPRDLEALRKFLSSNSRAVVIKTPKASEALAALWASDWKDIITTFTDRKTADLLGDMSKGQPGIVLANAYSVFVSADVVASLPEFKRPGPVTQLSDKLAKAAKVGGSSMVEETMAKLSLKDSKSRSIAAAFILATGAEPSIKLSRDERDMAEYLVQFAKNIIAAGGDGYRDAMNTLLIASGANEKVS